MFGYPFGSRIIRTPFGSVTANSSSPRSGIRADLGRLSVLGIGYGNSHIRPECLIAIPKPSMREGGKK
ncbi:hypothetical protein RHMOL_Rhmol04G0192200 [Rhododendron molle]|uniref:Uncharacterized protein n=1 Tax=Rhododendron molle TaxID=49168 RepID=A0ACC0P297_RHOML|nr:hypothetical protein RHMOL_Rhmol04G0192200 [Rhododendron molle]